jgi:plastocyanin
MQKRLYFLAAIIGSIALLVVAVFLFFQGHHAEAPSITSTVQRDQFAGITPVATHRIAIDNGDFSPQVAKIKQGESVIWTNNDMTDYSIEADALPGLQSDSLASGASFSYVFDTPGEYVYHCAEQSDCVGKIIVTD